MEAFPACAAAADFGVMARRVLAGKGRLTPGCAALARCAPPGRGNSSDGGADTMGQTGREGRAECFERGGREERFAGMIFDNRNEFQQPQLPVLAVRGLREESTRFTRRPLALFRGRRLYPNSTFGRHDALSAAASAKEARPLMNVWFPLETTHPKMNRKRVRAVNT